MSKKVIIHIDDDVYKTLADHANAEKRSIASFIEMAAMQYTKESEFVDIDEMSDIIEDSGLIKRLKQGMGDAKARRGRKISVLTASHRKEAYR